MVRKVAILGSTGSIGKNTLKVAANLKEKVQIVALAARSNIDLLEEQARECNPQVIAVFDKEKALILQKRIPHVRVLGGMEGLCEAASLADVDTVVSALVGAAGLLPTAAAIEAKKRIALANKEVLVAAGAYIIPLAKKHGVSLIPVDSEHNAIFQCLDKEDPAAVRRLILTSSGGPFRGWTAEQLKDVTPEKALKHPNFSMGAKITIDSSTLMNKGLEVIEAYWLFGVQVEQIEVLVHPQQKIHSMVEFIDGSILAQMSEPDMLLPIQYAITYPERCPGILEPYDFVRNNRLDFLQPDRSTFRCLDLAYAALKEGGTLPCFMNAVNEVLVGKFLNKEIGWTDISAKLETLMGSHQNTHSLDLPSILAVDQMAREQAQLC
ncbi:MAG: 1-deoxy-D-xylulose-5-phosphate reductoisomerase [Verrucomicrobia bacterium]|nr:1-deoxy-D-xylulose-5-phosphate reductoisomerase [Verrucomicrobiota bacterium]